MGFVAAALRNGADLVPCLNYGENGLYRQVKAASLRSIQQAMVKRIGFSLSYKC